MKTNLLTALFLTLAAPALAGEKVEMGEVLDPARVRVLA